MNVIITLSEYANFISKNFGLDKPDSFYRYLAKTNQLKNAFVTENGRWLIKVKSSIYQINNIEDLIKENIELKEKLNNIKKICD